MVVSKKTSPSSVVGQATANPASTASGK